MAYSDDVFCVGDNVKDIDKTSLFTGEIGKILDIRVDYKNKAELMVCFGVGRGGWLKASKLEFVSTRSEDESNKLWKEFNGK